MSIKGKFSSVNLYEASLNESYKLSIAFSRGSTKIDALEISSPSYSMAYRKSKISSLTDSTSLM
jgi:hypothetical protein